MTSFMDKVRGWGWKIIVPALVIAAFALGLMIRGGDEPAPGKEQSVAAEHQHDEEGEVLFWTCAMHPQIQQPGPGQCPICGMDLIPVYAGEEGGGSGSLGEREIKLSPYARKLAEIEESPVMRMEVSSEVRMVGKVAYDERKVGYITAWVPGRIDKLHVDFTGTDVEKGDPMVWLYSPELYSAQQELIEAWKAHRQLKTSGLESIRTTAWTTVEAARDKLRLWGLTSGQIKQIERRGRAEDHVTIYAPLSGVVIHKNGLEGMYVATGTKIYTIADLSRVWTMMDAYESDLVWLREGQEVEIRVEAYPGEIFKGRIEFIDPFLNPKTRTAKVRVTMPNPDLKLKPEMFVNGLVRPTSEDVQRVAGESAGQGLPLVIPASAPLITGKRAVVYVADPEREGVYQGRLVTLGPRAGDYYLVKEGLQEGEMVVTNGNFKIDSAIQIMAKPSMMNPEGGGPAPGHRHGSATESPAPADEKAGEIAGGHEGHKAEDEPREDGGGNDGQGSGAKGSETKVHRGRIYEAPADFKKQLDAALSAYLKVHQALAGDDLQGAVASARNVIESLKKVDMGLLVGEGHMEWMKQLETLNKSAENIAAAKDVNQARTWFQELSDAMHYSIHSFGPVRAEPVYRIHCPMAFDGQGADWLQDKKEVENPYYGKVMLKCGSLAETISPGKDGEKHDHEGSGTKGSDMKGEEHRHE